jgi:GH35 family endo-1,4-beta-xylanase
MANAEWLGNGPASTYTKFTGEDLEAILVNHIRTVMGHYLDKYPGVIKWWDVTNETMGWNHQFNSDGILWTKIGTNPDRALLACGIFGPHGQRTLMLSYA